LVDLNKQINTNYMKNNYFKNKKILVTGGAGFLGSKVVATLIKSGADKKNIFVPRSNKQDLRDPKECMRAVKNKDIVIHCAATVGGIEFNKKHPATIFFNNMAMGLHLMDESCKAGVKKFVMIGTVCEYPKVTAVPFKEEDLWLGYPEESNGAYGMSKKAILVQGQAYKEEYGLNVIHLLLENLYGPGDNFNPISSHVIPALIRKVEIAKEKKEPIVVWGSGKATREFLYADDAAEAIVLATQRYNQPNPVNIGSGQEISIKKLVTLICQKMDYKGQIIWDKEKPDGQLRRAIDITKAKNEFGFNAKTDFKTGLTKTIHWYLKNKDTI